MASSWRGLVLRLCLVGFFINCQPSEPFLTKYLKREKNITEVRVLHPLLRRPLRRVVYKSKRVCHRGR